MQHPDSGIFETRFPLSCGLRQWVAPNFSGPP